MQRNMMHLVHLIQQYWVIKYTHVVLVSTIIDILKMTFFLKFKITEMLSELNISNVMEKLIWQHWCKVVYVFMILPEWPRPGERWRRSSVSWGTGGTEAGSWPPGSQMHIAPNAETRDVKTKWGEHWAQSAIYIYIYIYSPGNKSTMSTSSKK